MTRFAIPEGTITAATDHEPAIEFQDGIALINALRGTGIDVVEVKIHGSENPVKGKKLRGWRGVLETFRAYTADEEPSP